MHVIEAKATADHQRDTHVARCGTRATTSGLNDPYIWLGHFRQQPQQPPNREQRSFHGPHKEIDEGQQHQEEQNPPRQRNCRARNNIVVLRNKCWFVHAEDSVLFHVDLLHIMRDGSNKISHSA